MDFPQRIRDMYQGRTLVFGHRGALAYAPMNTLPGFELAVEQGAHGVELDVQRSKDGYPIVLHNFTVDDTTDGTGDVTEMTLPQLRELDAGSWFSEEFKRTQIPLLDEVFEAVGKKVYVNVELKTEGRESDGIEPVVADCIARHGMKERVIVSSFNPMSLHRFRAIMPDVLLAFLFRPYMDTDTKTLLGDLKHEMRHPFHELIDEAYMKWAHKSGYVVNTWTVDDPQRAIELHNLGVHGITTNTPDVILDTLQLRKV